ncbi:MAG: tetratricopeptide repeat protein [Anaerolineales bacterium]|jgi:tetratricopeptide (TPR) repeat protein
MQLRGENLSLGSGRRRSNPGRILIYLALIGGALYLYQLIDTGRLRPLFSPTPTPTRVAYSYAEEARTLFAAGDLKGAIEAYTGATQSDPSDAQLWADLARVQTYSSALLNVLEDRRSRMAEAMLSIERAIELNPDDSYVQAIRALVYDWAASAEEFSSSDRVIYLREAEASAKLALQLDSQSILAQSFYAEVLLDQQKYAQAEDYAAQAVVQAEAQGNPSMDIYRVYGTVLESLGAYRLAIEEYEKALSLAPKFPFLYLQIGVNYRQLRDINTALQYFELAARINEENQVDDPTPYLAIGKTYLQQGQFFIAARNVLRGLTIAPEDADIYGRLGVVYHKARNYESAIEVFSCAIDGCAAETSQDLICELYYGLEPPCAETEGVAVDGVLGLMLDSDTLVYYYTYGSVLAYYAGTEEYPNACQDAERLFRTLERSSFGSDPIVVGIITEGRAILANECPPFEYVPVIPEPTVEGAGGL